MYNEEVDHVIVIDLFRLLEGGNGEAGTGMAARGETGSAGIFELSDYGVWNCETR
jgi:hypothetical protein